MFEKKFAVTKTIGNADKIVKRATENVMNIALRNKNII